MKATLIKSNPVWKVSGLRGASEIELNSILSHIVSDPACPGKVLMLDLGEVYSFQELCDTGIRRLLQNKL